jgi:Uma2 family endonuclease
MATTPTRLMTFAEFAELPDPREGHYELHHGELFHMAPPKHGHKRVQHTLQRLLSLHGGAWVAATEVGFRPTLDSEYWTADVALMSTARWEQTPADEYLESPPELVIEVLSPSNSAAEMEEKSEICLASGAREFWVVSPLRKSVVVSTPDGHSVRYTMGQPIPLLTGGTLAVDDIFSS